jgi:arylsulfatase
LKLGVIPADCRLTARPKEIPAWDDMPEAFKPVLRRDGSVCGVPGLRRSSRGPAARHVEGLGILDDTLIYYIIGDNGASAEGRSTAASMK